MKGPSTWLRTRRRGFTLIEIIVSVTLLLLLAGTLVANYNGFNSSQIVTQAASTFKNNLRSVRTTTTSGLKPDGCTDLVGYEVTFPGTTSYASSAVCLVGGVQEPVGVEVTYTLPNSVQFTSLPQTILFRSPDGTTTDQTIELSGPSKTLKIIVSASGGIGDFVPTPTP